MKRSNAPTKEEEEEEEKEEKGSVAPSEAIDH
jgi:hypothetical protein